jgi:hypothetical protein
LTRLSAYLRMLAQNETAYEVHRQWRKAYRSARVGGGALRDMLLGRSYECSICAFVAQQAALTALGGMSPLQKRLKRATRRGGCSGPRPAPAVYHKQWYAKGQY